MQIKFTRLSDLELIREYATLHSVKPRKAIIMALQEAKEAHKLRGKIAAYEFLLNKKAR